MSEKEWHESYVLGMQLKFHRLGAKKFSTKLIYLRTEQQWEYPDDLAMMDYTSGYLYCLLVDFDGLQGRSPCY